MRLSLLLPLTLTAALAAQVPEAPLRARRAHHAEMKAEVDALNQAFGEAMAKGDAEAVANFYAERGQLLFFKGATFKDRASIRSFLGEFLKSTTVKSMTITSEETHRMGAFVLDIGRHSMTTVADGKETTSGGRYMQVLRKERDGKLHIFRDCPLPD